MARDVGLGEIALIGGVAVLGAYAVGKMKNGTTTVTPSENWEGVNKVIDKLGDQNSEFLNSVLQILEKDGQTMPDAGGSGSGGGSMTPSPSLPESPEETIKQTKQVLDLTNTALDRLGYSGLVKQSETLMAESVDKDKETIASNPVLNALEHVNTKPSSGSSSMDRLRDFNSWTALTKPSTYSEIYHGIHGAGEWIYNTLTGKKNVDSDLSVL